MSRARETLRTRTAIHHIGLFHACDIGLGYEGDSTAVFRSWDVRPARGAHLHRLQGQPHGFRRLPARQPAGVPTPPHRRRHQRHRKCHRPAQGDARARSRAEATRAVGCACARGRQGAAETDALKTPQRTEDPCGKRGGRRGGHGRRPASGRAPTPQATGHQTGPRLEPARPRLRLGSQGHLRRHREAHQRGYHRRLRQPLQTPVPRPPRHPAHPTTRSLHRDSHQPPQKNHA